MIGDIHQTTGHGIRRICAILDVPRSSYYHACAPTAMQSSDQEVGGKIETIFKHHRRRYGYRRIKDELSDHGIVCAPCRVRRIMLSVASKLSSPRPTSRGPAMAGPTNHLPISYLTNPFPANSTRYGPATSPSFPPPPAGSIWLSS